MLSSQFIKTSINHPTNSSTSTLYFLSVLCKSKNEGYVCYIVPNKFFKISAGAKLRGMLSNHLISLDDFGAAQLFEDKTIYSSIVLLQNEFKKDLHIQMLIPLMICGWENRQIVLNLIILP